jgi:excisionase family DNA binding protein
MATNRLTLAVEEAGTLLGTSRTLAYELARRGEIPSLRLGR